MGELAPMRPSGLRRYSQFNAIVDKLAKGFEGQEGLSPSRLLNKLKRAAPYMGVPRNVVSLMDVLVAFSRSQGSGSSSRRPEPSITPDVPK